MHANGYVLLMYSRRETCAAMQTQTQMFKTHTHTHTLARYRCTLLTHITSFTATNKHCVIVEASSSSERMFYLIKGI